MKRVKLEVAYDGTNYCGFQIQPGDVTVEGELNKALSELFGEEIKVIGASRTDSGVHALGNVVVFDTSSSMPADKVSFALNQRLPRDIVIQASEEVASDFHPRRCVSEKVYQYKILNTKFPVPTLRHTTHFFHYPLDIEKMQEAANVLVGEHDFKSFCSIKTQTLTTVRTIYGISITKSDDIITIEVRGNGFLYNMVRIIAGTLIKVGTGHTSVEEVKNALEGLDRELAGPTAPANGLCLVKIKYDNLDKNSLDNSEGI